MAKFTSDNQPANRGRKRGSKNIKQAITPEMEGKAKDVLLQALEAGEQWACEAVLKRTAAPLKAVTPIGSLDAELLEARIHEMTELAKKVEELEEMISASGK